MTGEGAPVRPADQVDVSVLVPVLNEERHIREAAVSMRAQRFDGKVEFLFVDGRSGDATGAILGELALEDPRLRLLENPNRQTAAGLNVGLRHARGVFVARMDGHAVYPPDYLARAVERLARGDVEWVCGPQVPSGAGTWSRRVALALESRLGTGASDRFGGGGGEADIDSGVFTGVWRKETLDAFGGWDEGWPVNQDSELAARILAAGGRIVSLEALGALYFPRNSLKALARQYWRYGFYRAKTGRRHPASLRRSHLLAPGVTAATLGAVVGPRPVRTLGRAALLVYATVLGAAGAQAVRAGRGSDGAALPAVLGTMHMAWGLGFISGCLRFGPPLRAFAVMAGFPGSGAPMGGRARPAPSNDSAGNSRLAVYTDYPYRRLGDSVYAPRAFAVFVSEMRHSLDSLILVGRLESDEGEWHYPLPREVEFAPLPPYESLTSPLEALPAVLRSLWRWWRVLDRVDRVWLLGPQGLALPFALLAALHRKRVALGVRQDLPRYVASRHPDKRWIGLAAGVLEAAFRGLARRWPIVVVGPDLGRNYRAARRLLVASVSLVRAADIVPTPTALARAYDGELRMLSVGRLEREKNPVLLADVLARARELDDRWRLVVCGEGPMLRELEERLRRLGVAEHAELRGYVPVHDGLLGAYRDCHAMVHVSWTEGVPQVLFEAFAAGLPVVATAVGGVPEAVGDAAVLMPPGDADAATRALERIAGDPDLREQLIRSGLERATRATLEAESRRVALFLAGE